MTALADAITPSGGWVAAAAMLAAYAAGFAVVLWTTRHEEDPS